MSKVDEDLIDAARRCAEIIAGWGLDYYSDYADLLKAIDAKELSECGVITELVPVCPELAGEPPF